jgi:hypothetical protein
VLPAQKLAKWPERRPQKPTGRRADYMTLCAEI